MSPTPGTTGTPAKPANGSPPLEVDGIREHTTLLVQGPPGVGTTHLVVALGVAAIEQGFRVAFYRLEELLHEMPKEAAVAPQALRRQKSFNLASLVVDQVGFAPMSREDARLFVRLVSYR